MQITQQTYAYGLLVRPDTVFAARAFGRRHTDAAGRLARGGQCATRTAGTVGARRAAGPAVLANSRRRERRREATPVRPRRCPQRTMPACRVHTPPPSNPALSPVTPGCPPSPDRPGRCHHPPIHSWPLGCPCPAFALVSPPHLLPALRPRCPLLRPAETQAGPGTRSGNFSGHSGEALEARGQCGTAKRGRGICSQLLNGREDDSARSVVASLPRGRRWPRAFALPSLCLILPSPFWKPTWLPPSASVARSQPPLCSRLYAPPAHACDSYICLCSSLFPLIHALSPREPPIFSTAPAIAQNEHQLLPLAHPPPSHHRIGEPCPSILHTRYLAFPRFAFALRPSPVPDAAAAAAASAPSTKPESSVARGLSPPVLDVSSGTPDLCHSRMRLTPSFCDRANPVIVPGCVNARIDLPSHSKSSSSPRPATRPHMLVQSVHRTPLSPTSHFDTYSFACPSPLPAA